MKLKAKLAGVVDGVKVYWNRPAKGRYMSFKEIFALSFGGMGVQFVTSCISAMILAVGNTLIGNTIGIPPMLIGVLYAVSVIVSFPLGALRSNMIDRSRFKKGKYRPYIVWMGIPSVLLGIAFVWMPYGKMNMFMKCATVLAFNIAFQFFYMFYNDAYTSLPNVLSSNTIERSDVCAIRSPVASFAPTIIGAALPFVAKLVTGQDNNMADIRIYRVFYPVLLIIGFFISLLIYYQTEEKVIEAKTHVIKVKLSDAFRAVSKNKYFWIIAIASSTGVLEAAYTTILWWLYNYQQACSTASYSIVTLINGNAALWPMLLAPLFIRLFGKRKLLIFSNLLNILFILIMFPVMKYADMSYMIWIMLVCMFINGMATHLGETLNPSIQGDIRDYQQYIGGERIDGMFVYLTIIANFATMIFGFVLLALQEHAGLTLGKLNELLAAGQLVNPKGDAIITDNVYEVLYNTELFRNIALTLIWVSVGGAILNTLPYFFYDMTEMKQRSMVTVLKIRALFEDYGNNALSDEKLVEAIDLIRESKAHVNMEKIQLCKDSVKAAKKEKESCKKAFSAAKKSQNAERIQSASEALLLAKSALSAARKKYYADKETNQKIDIAQYVVKEINKFDTEIVQRQVDRAQEIVDAGIGGFVDAHYITLAEAKSLPKKSEEEKEARKLAITQAKNFDIAKKLVKKRYPDGLQLFDSSRIDATIEKLDNCETKLETLFKQMNEAKKSAAPEEQIEAYSEELARLKKQRKAMNAYLKTLGNEYSLYIRAARPYIESVTLLRQKENYEHYEEIAERYEESKRRAEEELAAQLAKEAEEKAQKLADIERMKAEKQAKKDTKAEIKTAKKETKAQNKLDTKAEKQIKKDNAEKTIKAPRHTKKDDGEKTEKAPRRTKKADGEKTEKAPRHTKKADVDKTEKAPRRTKKDDVEKTEKVPRRTKKADGEKTEKAPRREKSKSTAKTQKPKRDKSSKHEG